jgi:flagellar assembly factor FliW
VPEAAPLLLLRSTEEAALEFVVPPSLFYSDYAPEIDDANAARLRLTDAGDALLLVVFTIGTDASPATPTCLRRW